MEARERLLPTRSPRVAGARRTLVFGLTLLSTVAAAAELHRLLALHGHTALEGVLLALFTGCFAWVALFFWTSLCGFVHLARRGRTPGLRWPTPAEEALPLTRRTAVVMPIHNEDAAAVCAHLEATYASLARTGQLDAFDFFLLSDSTSPEAWVAEEVAWAELCRRVEGQGRLFYRRRSDNRGKKAGNLADFCERWGRRYDFMVVLDADSVMAGDTLVAMARLMELNPGAGILQVPPVCVGRSTLFARLQQFASRVYGPVVAAGAGWWQLGESNYWGHNAILRVAAFAQHCGLPVLPGREPFGGHILSHDFVEAALMRRAGYTVWLLPELGGSYEQPPPNLLAYAARDRRWCQGNLQHLHLLFAGGLHPLSRLHFLSGVMSYAASPLWLLFLAVGLLSAWQDGHLTPDYFPDTPTLFPAWPVYDVEAAVRLWVLSLCLLLVPKLLGLLLVLGRCEEAARMGGRARVVASVLAETLVSMLLAPVMMLFQSLFVVTTLLGHRVSWTSQQREDQDLPWREAAARHAGHTLLGVALGLAGWALSPGLLAWLSPVVTGLLLSIPLTVLGSRASLGARTRRWGLFLTPEEVAPPPVLAQALAAGAAPPTAGGLRRVLEDGHLRALHLALLEADSRAARAPTAALAAARQKLAEGRCEALSRQEQLAVLLDPTTLQALPVPRPGHTPEA